MSLIHLSNRDLSELFTPDLGQGKPGSFIMYCIEHELVDISIVTEFCDDLEDILRSYTWLN